MRFFFGAHRDGVAFGLIPEAGFLRDAAAGFEDGDVALDFVFERFLQKAEGVEVFYFDLGAEFFFCVTKLGRFDRSTGGVGFGEEKEQDALGVEIFQGEFFALVRLETEIGGFGAWFQHLITLSKQLE